MSALTDQIKADAERAARDDVTAEGKEVAEVLLVGDPALTGGRLHTNVRLTVKDEVQERAYRYECALDGTAGRLVRT